ncbi:MAG: hypothetical protein AB1918_14420 [Pseudomonadota bacterium]
MKDLAGFESQFSIQGASALFRKARLMTRVAEHVRHMGKDQAYRAGIGPIEYDAIVANRVSAVETSRLESLYAKLTGGA